MSLDSYKSLIVIEGCELLVFLLCDEFAPYCRAALSEAAVLRAVCGFEMYPIRIVPRVSVELRGIVAILARKNTEEKILPLVVLVGEHRVDILLLLLRVANLAAFNGVGSVDIPTMQVDVPSHLLELVSMRTVILNPLLTNVQVYHLVDERVVYVLLWAHVVVGNLDTVALAVSWVATTPESVLLVADDELRLTQLILEILIVVLLECLL